jgi:hypothetical protein
MARFAISDAVKSLTFRRRLTFAVAKVKRLGRGRSQNVSDSLDFLHAKGVI